MIKYFSKLLHLLQRFGQQSIIFPKYVNNFGFIMACYIVIDRLFPQGRGRRYQKAVYKYLNSKYNHVARKYEINNVSEKESHKENKTPKIIWVCWFQGEDNMPELVKMCYCNLKERISDSEIKLILLTHNNIEQYIEIPGYIKEKYHKGIISNAHYSDILRCKLMRYYGGCWIDSTVFVTKKIDADIFSRPFFTMKMQASRCPKEPCAGLWTNFFYIARPQLNLFNIINDILDIYWREHNVIIDYIIMDYIMLVAYRQCQAVREIMDNVPYNNEELWYMWDNIDKPYSEELYHKITDKGQFYKLSYQKQIEKTVDGKETLYGHLLSTL